MITIPDSRPREQENCDAHERAAQREYIADLLRQRGSIPKLELITGTCGRLISQAAARIFELEKLGWKIEHRRTEGSRFVTYVLISEPSISEPSTEPSTQLSLLANAPRTTSEFCERERGVR